MHAVVEIPEFPLQALARRREGGIGAGPRAALDEAGERSRVAAANAAARRAGVRTGASPAQALARCPELELETRSEAAEAEAGRVLALLAGTLSPRVELSAPGRATVDLRGTGRRGRRERLAALVERCAENGLQARAGLARTPEHARWAALLARPVREAAELEPFLDELPVSAAEPSERAAAVLAEWGVRRLGDVWRLPREGLGRRLGREGLALWDAAAGRTERPLRCHAPPPRFERRQDLEQRVETLPALRFIVRRFVDELALELEAAGAAAEGMRLRLGLDDAPAWEKRLEAPEASARAETLYRMLETALETARTSAPVVSVTLELETAEARPRQGDLFAVAMEDASGFARSADRIAAILGPGRSGSPRPEDTWRPDAFRMEAMATEIRSESETAGAEAAVPEGLPLRRFRPPRPARVWTAEGAPARVAAEGRDEAVRARRGPWRFSGAWWSGEAWAREEWDVELESGGTYRIFRDKEGWHADGVYG